MINIRAYAKQTVHEGLVSRDEFPLCVCVCVWGGGGGGGGGEGGGGDLPFLMFSVILYEYPT